MKNIYTFLLGLGLLSTLNPGSAQAGPADYCAPVAGLTENLSSCTQNEVLFGEAAVLCLQKFEREAEQASRELAQSLVGAGTAATGNQEASFRGTEQNYLAARSRLDALIASGRLALGQVAQYGDNLALPEDLENAPAMGFTPEAFLASIPCYDENRRLLLDVASDFTQKIAELESARQAAVAKENSADGSRRNVGATAGQAPGAARTRGRGAGVPAGRSAHPTSDVTGTERQEAPLPSR